MKVEYVDHMGDDMSVVNAARVSFDKVGKWKRNLLFGRKTLYRRDVGLINYLARNKHWSPFAHTSITLRMKAPIPVRTQCMKHAVGMNINEESRRYIDSRPEVFVPDFFRSAPEGSIKQGSGGKHPGSEDWIDYYKINAESMVHLYEAMISDGIAPEQARFILPQGCEVNWIWTGNLASFARFYNERTDTHAQKETQDLAKLVASIIEPLYPVSWNALTKGESE